MTVIIFYGVLSVPLLVHHTFPSIKILMWHYLIRDFQSSAWLIQKTWETTRNKKDALDWSNSHTGLLCCNVLLSYIITMKRYRNQIGCWYYMENTWLSKVGPWKLSFKEYLFGTSFFNQSGKVYFSCLFTPGVEGSTMQVLFPASNNLCRVTVWCMSLYMLLFFINVDIILDLMFFCCPFLTNMFAHQERQEIRGWCSCSTSYKECCTLGYASNYFVPIYSCIW